MSVRPVPPAEPAFRDRSRALARVLAGGVTVLAVAAAVALLAATFLSYATVKHRLDAFASDHDANLSRARFDTIVWQLRLASAALVVVAGAVHLRRRRLAEWLAALLRSVRADARQGIAGLRRAIAAESALHLAALGAIAVGAVLVRLDFLFQPMRYDEADTYVHYASRPLYIGLTAYTAPNNHLFHTLLVHVSTALLGDRPWAIRLPALIAGVLLVPATYLAARLLYGKAAALLAAALVATSSTLIEYSTNARGYTLLALITLLLLALATHLVSSTSLAAWGAFAVLVAFGFWTIPIMLYPLGTVTVWLVWTVALEQRDARLLRTRLLPSLVAAGALTLILYTPVLVSAGPHALLGNSFVTPRSVSYVAHQLPSSLWATFARWHRDQPAPLWLLIAAGFVLSAVRHGRLSRFVVPPAAGAVVAIPPLLALQRVVPFERVWLDLLPLYLTSAAAGLVFAARRLVDDRRLQVGVAVVAVAVCAGLAGEAVASRAVYRSEDTSTFRDAPAVARFLEQVVRPGDRVLAAPPADQILEYYLDVGGLDAGRLLYEDFPATRLFAVVKQGPREYPLRVVLRRHLSPRAAGRLRAVVVRRFPHAVVYRMLR